MSFPRRSTLFGTLVRLDDGGSGPPWPMLLWNPLVHDWEAVGQPARGVLYEYGPKGLEFVLTAEGNVIGVVE